MLKEVTNKPRLHAVGAGVTVKNFKGKKRSKNFIGNLMKADENGIDSFTYEELGFCRGGAGHHLAFTFVVRGETEKEATQIVSDLLNQLDTLAVEPVISYGGEVKYKVYKSDKQ